MDVSTDIKNLFLLNVLEIDYSLSVYIQGGESLELISSTGNALGVLNFEKKKQEKKKELMLPIELLGSVVGALQVKIPHKHELTKKESIRLDELTKSLAPILRNGGDARELYYNTEVYKWVLGAKEKISQIADWIGVYYKTEYISGLKSEDLVLGPYIGESTEHVKIPISEGLCGLALREDRVVNVEDVQSDERHIACSLKTKSELIIPLRNSYGDSIAELDIDSNRLSAFSKEIEEEIKEYCLSFPLK
ncbi:GAF domain-containing protein [Halobacteriovorax sp.]|uniref:GAF domain-containing protein n=1 Tax=Halobacteriovorax sp. TaxID=2020862 RepID=UPI0035666997